MNHLPLIAVASVFMIGMLISALEIQNNDSIVVVIYPHMPPY
ncbi:hypothetical protein HNP92_002018 [Methanococcus maripaludis]|uniref:Uncharacterized protein n=1 Tax=Methanococcus maripaludis TaxID=39152 RepID=A0A7J9S9X0_METMI|nr:hypothetical protein [Methanococcus maripaludis]MBB6402693.1 hypothetical protein [Methanococcus maripaludis]